METGKETGTTTPVANGIGIGTSGMSGSSAGEETVRGAAGCSASASVAEAIEGSRVGRGSVLCVVGGGVGSGGRSRSPSASGTRGRGSKRTSGGSGMSWRSGGLAS